MHCRLITLFAVMGFALILQAQENRRMAYPPTKVEKVTEKIHGVEISDPYRWLENNDSPEVQKWTEVQNAFTRSVLDKLPGRQQIHDRLSKLTEIGRLGA